MPVSSLHKKSPPCAVPVALLFLSADFATAQEKEFVDPEDIVGLPDCIDPPHNGQCAKACEKSLGNIGKTFRFKMAGWHKAKTDIVWGQGPYFYGSYADEAATHKGLFEHEEVGYIEIKCVDTPTPDNADDPPFVGNTQNGMTTKSLSWGEVYENTAAFGPKIMTAGAFEVTRFYVRSEGSEVEETPVPTKASADENTGGDGDGGAKSGVPTLTIPNGQGGSGTGDGLSGNGNRGIDDSGSAENDDDDDDGFPVWAIVLLSLLALLCCLCLLLLCCFLMRRGQGDQEVFPYLSKETLDHPADCKKACCAGYVNLPADRSHVVSVVRTTREVTRSGSPSALEDRFVGEDEDSFSSSMMSSQYSLL